MLLGAEPQKGDLFCYTSVVQWHPFSLFWGCCPTKNGPSPKKGSLFLPGSTEQLRYMSFGQVHSLRRTAGRFSKPSRKPAAELPQGIAWGRFWVSVPRRTQRDQRRPRRAQLARFGRGPFQAARLAVEKLSPVSFFVELEAVSQELSLPSRDCFSKFQLSWNPFSVHRLWILGERVCGFPLVCSFTDEKALCGWRSPLCTNWPSVGVQRSQGIIPSS